MRYIHPKWPPVPSTGNLHIPPFLCPVSKTATATTSPIQPPADLDQESSKSMTNTSMMRSESSSGPAGPNVDAVNKFHRLEAGTASQLPETQYSRYPPRADAAQRTNSYNEPINQVTCPENIVSQQVLRNEDIASARQDLEFAEVRTPCAPISCTATTFNFHSVYAQQCLHSQPYGPCLYYPMYPRLSHVPPATAQVWNHFEDFEMKIAKAWPGYWPRSESRWGKFNICPIPCSNVDKELTTLYSYQTANEREESKKQSLIRKCRTEENRQNGDKALYLLVEAMAYKCGYREPQHKHPTNVDDDILTPEQRSMLYKKKQHEDLQEATYQKFEAMTQDHNLHTLRSMSSPKEGDKGIDRADVVFLLKYVEAVHIHYELKGFENLEVGDVARYLWGLVVDAIPADQRAVNSVTNAFHFVSGKPLTPSAYVDRRLLTPTGLVEVPRDIHIAFQKIPIRGPQFSTSRQNDPANNGSQSRTTHKTNTPCPQSKPDSQNGSTHWQKQTNTAFPNIPSIGSYTQAPPVSEFTDLRANFGSPSLSYTADAQGERQDIFTSQSVQTDIGRQSPYLSSHEQMTDETVLNMSQNTPSGPRSSSQYLFQQAVGQASHYVSRNVPIEPTGQDEILKSYTPERSI